MRIVRYEKGWQAHYGLVEGDAIYELRGDPFEDARPGDRAGGLGEVKLLAPCAPETIWSNGANYPSRCRERGHPLPTAPQVAVCPGSAICGTDAEIRVPEFENRCEYGAELGIVVRKDCSNVEESESDEYILGYTGLNNIWIKDPDEKKAYIRPLRVYDDHCPTGLFIDTDRNWRDRRIRLWVNGELRQDDTTSSMLFSPAAVVSYISKVTPMKKGDLIMTGTPGGVEGHVLHFGETVEMEVDGCGRLRNRVVRVDNAAVTYVVSVKKWVELKEAEKVAKPTTFS